MSLKRPEDNKVDVDMVPLIDIISLLLMFLVMVGDMEKNTTSVKMRLPRADQARTDDPHRDYHNRIVVQMKYDTTADKYWAVVDNNKYEIVSQGGNGTLINYLAEQSNKINREEPNIQGEGPYPVKLRIPASTPMREVERLVMTLAQAKLVNIQYACEPIQR